MVIGLRTSVRHRSEIDGLRAIAVLPVILFHARFGLFQGGFVGVDIFFVISGFLITSIIIDALEEDRFSFLQFYSRRVRRILPALVLVVLVAIPGAWIIMLPEDFKQFAESVGAVGAFVSNVLFWMKSGYFAAGAENNPLLHTWSLAVEEQFYIGFPFLMLCVWRLRRAAVTFVLTAILFASLALCQWASHGHPDANFYLAPTRAWELMLGAVASLWVHHTVLRANALLAALGLFMIIVAIFLYSAQTPFPSLYTLLPTCGSALVLICANDKTAVGRLLSMRPFVATGTISYSAYLWHQPIFAFARIIWHGEPSLPVMLLLATSSLCLGYPSWRFVEQPFRTARWPARNVVVAGAAASIGLVALGTLLVVSGIQKRAFMATLPRPRVETLNRIESVSHKEFFPVDDGACRFGTQSVPTVADAARMESCAQRFGPAIVVFGDSHADNLQRALYASGDAPPFLVEMDKGADCDPLARPDCLSGIMVKFLTRHRNAIGALIFEQAGFYMLLDSNGRPSRREIFVGHDSPVASPNLQAITGVAEYLDVLRTQLRVPVIWVGPWLEPYVPMERLLAFDCQDAPKYLAVDAATASIFTKLDDAVDAISKGHRYRYVSAIRSIGFDARYDILDCSNIYWNDGDHFSVAGETRFGKRLIGPIMRLLPTQTIGHEQ